MSQGNEMAPSGAKSHDRRSNQQAQDGMAGEGEHPIFRNAINAIQVGVEDFNDGSPPRLASAVRNLVAGILLMCKEKLRRLSPADEMLIWKNHAPSLDEDGNVVFSNIGKTTVDVQEIINRFKYCRLEFDGDLLKRITKVRNDVEHHYVADVEHIRGAFADGLMFLSKFMPSHLGVDPQDQIDEDSWSTLVETKGIEDKLRAECRNSYSGVRWPELMKQVLESEGCPTCSSSLIRQLDSANQDPFHATWSCRACGHAEPNAEWMSKIVEDHFGPVSYLSAKDGGDDPVDNCPECGDCTFVHSELMCFACGFKVDDLGKCLVCGAGLGLDEYGVSICAYHRHVADKERDR